MTKQTTIRLSEQSKNQLSKIWGSVTEGVQRASNAYINLRERVLHDIKGVFTKQELLMLIDLQNGIILDASHMANVDIWRHEIEDAIKFKSADAEWNVDSAELFQKIDDLHEVYIYFLREEIDRFWNISDTSTDEFIDKFSE